MLYSVQFLRGLAALLVVISHTLHKAEQYEVNSIKYLTIGGSGVDLFFIISGFIMCYTTYGKKVYFINFMKNRIKRILPLYWSLTLIALIIFLTFPHLVNSSGGKTGIIESFLLLPNGSKFLINNGWTLSFEFYYYFIFALSSIILFKIKENNRYFLIISFLFLLSSIGLIVSFKNPYLIFLTNNIILEFGFGIFAFLIFKNYTLSLTKSISLILFGITSLIYINSNSLPNLMEVRAIKYGIPMLMIFIGFISIEKIFSKSKSIFISLINHIGNASYSLYLIHPFVLTPAAIILIKLNIYNSFIFNMTLILSSIIAGSITYIFIEKKINNIVKKYL